MNLFNFGVVEFAVVHRMLTKEGRNNSWNMCFNSKQSKEKRGHVFSI